MSLPSLDFTSFMKLAWNEVVDEPPKFEDLLASVSVTLNSVIENKIPRLAITASPPFYGRSTLISVLFPAWLWGPQGLSNLRIISACYRRDQLVQCNNRLKRILSSAWYRDSFPEVEIKPPFDGGVVRLATGGYLLSLATGGASLGNRADMLILDQVDDPYSNTCVRNEEWFAGNMYTKLNSVDGTIISMSKMQLPQGAHQAVAGMEGALSVNF